MTKLARAPIIAIVFLLSACSVTDKATIKNNVNGCKFIGISCNDMKAGKEDQSSLRYLSKDAQWTKYTKVLIDPITFWGSTGNEASGEDQQMLIDYFHQQIVETAGKHFEIVSKPGPGVMRLDIALSEASSATPILRSVSVLYPQAHLISNIAYAVNGKFPFSGGLESATKLSDSETGKLLAGFIDHQVGGGSLTTGFQWQWGDAENVIDLWTVRTTDVVYSWTSGKIKPE